MTDIANVGFSEQENIVAVRTRNDDREVYVWMASAEEARALLALLPRTTTPEFLEQQQLHQKFRENLKAIAPRAPVTPTIIGINVAVFLLMLAAGAGLGAASGTYGREIRRELWTAHLGRRALATAHLGVRSFRHRAHRVQHVCAVLRWHVDRAPLWQRTFRRDLPVVGAGWQRGEQLRGMPMRVSVGASGAVFGVYGALLVFVLAAARRYSARPAQERAQRSDLAVLCIRWPWAPSLPFVDNSAHIGGLLGGAAAGWLLVRPFEPAARAVARALANRCRRPIGAVLAALAAPLCIARRGVR